MGVKWENTVAVCFDGASAMAGEFNGVQRRCKDKNKDIVYIHCYAHYLNLVLVSACTSYKENAMIIDFFGIIQMIYTFIEGSPIRHATFEKVIRETDLKLKTLKSLSDIRWACRAEAVAAVREQYRSLVKAIEEIIKNM